MTKTKKTSNSIVTLVFLWFILVSSFPVLIPFIIIWLLFYFFKSSISLEKIIDDSWILDKLKTDEKTNEKFIELLEKLKKSDKYRKDRILQKRRDLEDKLNEGNSSLSVENNNSEIISDNLNYYEEIITPPIIEEDIVIIEEKNPIKEISKYNYKPKKYKSSTKSIWDDYDSVMDDFKK